MDRLLNTIRQHDYYLLTEDFDSCTLPLIYGRVARTIWILTKCDLQTSRRSRSSTRRTRTARSGSRRASGRPRRCVSSLRLSVSPCVLSRSPGVRDAMGMLMLMLTAAYVDGQVQLGPRDPGLRAGVLEHRERKGRVIVSYWHWHWLADVVSSMQEKKLGIKSFRACMYY